MTHTITRRATKLKDKEKDKILTSIGLTPLRIKVKEVYDIEGLEIAIRKRLGETSLLPNKPITNWNKVKEALKEFLIEKGIPTVITVIVFIIILPKVIPKILFQNTPKNIQQKPLSKNSVTITPPTIPPAPSTHEKPQPQIPVVNNTVKVKVKVRIAGKYISENKNYVMYERIDTRKQRTVTIEDFLKMCECNATELYTDKLMEIFEYP
jgi:hypothetical protein